MAYSRIFFIKVNFLVAEARRETHLCIFLPAATCVYVCKAHRHFFLFFENVLHREVKIKYFLFCFILDKSR